MSTIAENWTLIFFAEGDDALEYLDLMEEEGEPAVIEQIVEGKLEDIDVEEIPEPEEENEEFEHDDGYLLVYNAELERLWLYEDSEAGDDI
jgi:hypothetical protein